MKRILLLTLGICLLMTFNAFASQILFTDGAFEPGPSDSSFTVPVGGADLTFSAAPAGATLWWDNIDGYGVQSSYEADEIEGPELLNLNFSIPSLKFSKASMMGKGTLQPRG